MSDTTTVMGWNVKSGGFRGYAPDIPVPEREDEIRVSISQAKARYDIESAVLPDTHRWGSYYHNEEAIARHLGFKAARHVLLDDERLNRDGGAEIGITLVTDSPIEQSHALDLDTRQGLGTILNIGGKSLQLIGVYLDDMSEDVRIRQIRALDSAIEPGLPTVLLGDFNLLRPRFDTALLSVRLRNLGVKALANALGTRSALGISVNGMDERRSYAEFEAHGFHDADIALERPTAPAKLPVFGIDYVFSRGPLTVMTFAILRNPAASDHAALVASLTLD